MTESDRLLDRAPATIFVLAGLLFIWSIANGFWELRLNNAYLESADPIVGVMKSKIHFQAVLDSLFLAANGVLIKVLLNIYKKVTSA